MQTGNGEWVNENNIPHISGIYGRDRKLAGGKGLLVVPEKNLERPH
jgi:hypothetical protein